MADRKTVMSWLEGLTQDDWQSFHSDSEVQQIAIAALALLKEQGKLKFFVDENGKITPLPVVVRCRDCKYWRKLLLNHDGDGACHADNPIRISHQNWFCADGERRTDDA